MELSATRSWTPITLDKHRKGAIQRVMPLKKGGGVVMTTEVIRKDIGGGGTAEK